MPAIPWQTGAAPAAAAPASATPTFPSGASWSQGSPGWDAYLTGLQQQYANANAQYPTGNLPTGTTASGGGFQLSPAQLQQWQNYFNQGAGGTTAGTSGGTPGYGIENVQTGTQYQPSIPWLTGGTQANGMITGQPGATSTALNLPWQSLGITPSSNAATMAANINASPFAGSNPANPYYQQILNAAGQGGNVPTFTPELVPTGQGGGSQWAQMVGGQLVGNPTPQEQALASYFGLTPGQTQYLPDMVNAVAAAPPGTLTSATVPMFNANVLQQAGGLGGLTAQEQMNYLRSLSGVGNS